MPTYEYRCEQGHTFEVVQRMSDDPVISCQTCEAPVQRVFHPVAVHFKGSGFYNTDYGTRKRSRERAESGEGAGKDAGSSSESSTSSKSDSGSKSESSSKSESGSKSESSKSETSKSETSNKT
jgi:putative FmdB family regulatory protein